LAARRDRLAFARADGHDPARNLGGYLHAGDDADPPADNQVLLEIGS
jgi:hypothetical protein